MRRRIDGVEASAREASLSRSLLERSPAPSLALSESQSQIESLTGQFLEQATDLKALISLCAGGLAYRVGRVGIMGMGRSFFLRPLSWAGGLGSEVTTFEFVNRTLLTLSPPGGEGVRSDSYPQGHRRDTLHASRLWSWSGAGGWREGLSTSFVSFGLLRGTGFLAREQNIVAQHLFQSAAMVAGHSIIPTGRGDSRIAPTLAEQFLQAEAMNLQMMAGSALMHSLAPGIQALERNLDLSLSTMTRNPASFLEDGLPVEGTLAAADAGARSRFFPNKTKEFAPTIHFMSSLKEEGAGRSAEEMAERYRSRFPKASPQNFSEKIIAASLATSLKDPLLQERLLQAYAQSENRGQLEQLYTAIAIKELFAHDAQNTPVGSFDNALLQTLLGRVLLENKPSLREARMQTLFQTMEEGSLSRSKMEKFLTEWSYDSSLRLSAFPRFSYAFFKKYRNLASQALKGYRLADKVILSNFIFALEKKNPNTAERIFKIFEEARNSGNYSPEGVNGALSYARRHPAGNLILRRLLHLLVVEDAPAKLLELQGPPDERNTLLFIAEMAHQGKSWESISETINGTRHNAYFNDLRLARKIVATSLEVHPSLIGKTEERSLFRARLYEAMNSFLISGKKLDAKELVRLLEVNGGGELERFHRQWADKKFDFELISAELFNHIVKVYGQIPDCEESIFIALAGAKQRDYLAKKMPPPGQAILRSEYERFLKRLGERDQILIREMPPGIPKSPAAKEAAFRNLRFRLWGLLHEWGHFLHHSGSDEAIRKEEGPISLANINRQNRLITEIWAYLQEQPWRAKNIDIDPWIIGERLGENFSLYLRHLNDQSYFGAVNKKLMAEAGIRNEPD